MQFSEPRPTIVEGRFSYFDCPSHILGLIDCLEKKKRFSISLNGMTKCDEIVESDWFLSLSTCSPILFVDRF